MSAQRAEQSSAVKVRTAEEQKAKKPTHYQIVLHDLRKTKPKVIKLEGVDVSLERRGERKVDVYIEDQYHVGLMTLRFKGKNREHAEAFLCKGMRKYFFRRVI